MDKALGLPIVLLFMAGAKELTPLMKQYWSVKNLHGDKIVLFRMGDFFEMFHDDAIEAAPILGIALTMRNKKSGDKTPMCGVPHHSIGGQINKLLEAGRKVAICDQVEDPKQAKGLVKREVTRILTPGMVFDPETLEGPKPNYLSCFDKSDLSFLEATTGEFFYYKNITEKQRDTLLSALAPVEILFLDEEQKLFLESKKNLWPQATFSQAPENQGSPKDVVRCLRDYAGFTQGEESLPLYAHAEERHFQSQMKLSSQVLNHLEVFQTYKGEKKGSLFYAINRTRTSGGARILRHWLTFPLADLGSIKKRQDLVREWTQSLGDLKSVREKLTLVGDLERRLGKVSQPQAHPRDLQSLAQSLMAALSLSSHLPELKDEPREVCRWAQSVESALVEEIPANFRDGGFIARGFHGRLDELIELSENSQAKIRDLENRERELTGITSLKVRYNNVFGFYIEVTNTHKSKVPEDRYMRKQTLTNAERYVTEELNDIEKKVITAKSQRAELELSLLKEFRDDLFKNMPAFLMLARACNQLDALTSMAWLALEESYVCPQIQDAGPIEIMGSRHPVVEQLSPTDFIANDIIMAPEQCLLLTGPNMAGKSTLMRQVALTALLAQMGSFVPASQARLPLFDQIFTRIGASDHLSEGLSTFMVEMQETAEMLQASTERSLVVLDEVGRGTSTYDGMSLAQAILEHFITELKSYTLFATHYHELTELSEQHPGRVINKHMAIHEEKGKILFRYHLSEGPAHKSYGLQVAKLAGIPASVVGRAAQILSSLEASAQKTPSSQLDFWQALAASPPLTKDKHPLVKEIQDVEIQKLTPLEALNRLAKWQQELS